MHILTSLTEPNQGERLWLAELWARIANDGNDWRYTSIRFYRGKYRRWQSLSTYEAVKFAHQEEDTWGAIRAKNGAARYVIKYATKPYQKNIPVWYRNVGRWWGASRGITLGDYEVVTGSEAQIREYLKLRGRDMGGFDLLPKYIVINS